MSRINEESRQLAASPRTLRRFGLRFGAVLVLAALSCGWYYPLAGGLLVSFGVGLVVTSEFRPEMLRRVHRRWTAAAAVLGRIVPPALLALVFYLLVTPIGSLQRLLRKPPIDLRFRTGAASYWEPRQRDVTRAGYEKQF